MLQLLRIRTALEGHATGVLLRVYFYGGVALPFVRKKPLDSAP